MKALDALSRSSNGVELFTGCLSAFDSPHWVVRKQAARILKKLGKSPQLADALKASYNSGSVDQRYWILKVLAQTRGPEAMAMVRKLYETSRDASIRAHALSAASDIEGPESAEFLVRALSDDSWLNRSAAAGYLEERGQDVLKLLQKGFAEGSGDLKYWCLRLILRIVGPESRATIIKGMKSDDANIRHYVLRAMEDVEGDWVIPLLIEFLSDHNWSNRKVAANLLRARGRNALRHLAAGLQAGSPDARYWVVRTLGETGDERAVKPIEDFLYAAESKEEGLWALEALGRVRCSSSARVVLEASYQFPNHEDLVRTTLTGMGVSALRPLVEYLDSPNETIRRVAYAVLKELPFAGAKGFSTALEGLTTQGREGLISSLRQLEREQLEELFSRPDLTLDQIRQAAAKAPPRAFPTMSTISVQVHQGQLEEVVAELEEPPERPLGRSGMSLSVSAPAAAPAPAGSATQGAAPVPSAPPAPPSPAPAVAAPAISLAQSAIAPPARGAAPAYGLTLHEILAKAVKAQASDVHLKPNHPPLFRIHGNLRQTDLPPLTRETTHAFALDVLPPLQRRQFETGSFEVDAAYSAGPLGRFRVNCYHELTGPGVAMRHIPGKISTLADLKLPRVFRDLCMLEQGLILVTGPTGAGKSTTLAAMVDYINSSQEMHIITIEDPVEFLHESRNSVITSRELGSTTRSFADALRAALREDPDVILIGEMRDLETIQLALTAAETGHLVLSTLHTCSAGETVDRIINVFPANHHEMIRTTLASTLRAIVTQMLIPTVDAKRACIRDILIRNTAVANLIREGKLFQIDQAILPGRKEGMQSRDDDLQLLLKEGVISREVAYQHCTDKKTFLEKGKV